MSAIGVVFKMSILIEYINKSPVALLRYRRLASGAAGGLFLDATGAVKNVIRMHKARINGLIIYGTDTKAGSTITANSINVSVNKRQVIKCSI